MLKEREEEGGPCLLPVVRGLFVCLFVCLVVCLPVVEGVRGAPSGSTLETDSGLKVQCFSCPGSFSLMSPSGNTLTI